jgi:outer membrane protein
LRTSFEYPGRFLIRHFLPYVGAGLNYTVYSDGDPGDTQKVSYKDGFGFALNLGFKYCSDDRTYFNVDLKNVSFRQILSLMRGIQN